MYALLSVYIYVYTVILTWHIEITVFNLQEIWQTINNSSHLSDKID